MQHKISFLVILLVCAAIGFAGCTGTQSTPATQPATATPAATQVSIAPTQNNLEVSPTDSMPDNLAVNVIVQEKVYDGSIPVVFDGGKGQYLVTDIEVTLYRSDGTSRTVNLGHNKGDTVNLDGTKQTDRVVVYVSEVNGQQYKVDDVQSVYRTR